MGKKRIHPLVSLFKLPAHWLVATSPSAAAAPTIPILVLACNRVTVRCITRYRWQHTWFVICSLFSFSLSHLRAPPAHFHMYSSSLVSLAVHWTSYWNSGLIHPPFPLSLARYQWELMARCEGGHNYCKRRHVMFLHSYEHATFFVFLKINPPIAFPCIYKYMYVCINGHIYIYI